MGYRLVVWLRLVDWGHYLAGKEGCKTVEAGLPRGLGGLVGGIL